MAPDYASSIQGVAIRVCKLNAAGQPITGALGANVYRTSEFLTVQFTPEYITGDEIEEKSANGLICVQYKMPDVLKQVSLEIALCKPQPELAVLLDGGDLLMASLEVVGYAAPEIGVEANPNGNCIEVWTKAIVGGKPATTNPYWRWVFPYTRTRAEGSRVFQNGSLANVYSGWGLGNAGFEDGPKNDWLANDGERAYQYARDSAANLPSGQGVGLG